ncbi:EAL domain-containing protein [Methylibium sp.]|uniref:sensor domain-containing protein n=1 Tax=Methylibium sp. TaxID=2067992 RepID=UPI003D0C50CB
MSIAAPVLASNAGASPRDSLAWATVDALSEHACVVDRHGIVCAVNRAWRLRAAADSGRPRQAVEGSDYLGTCDSATGPEVDWTHAFAAGVRQVLAGRRERFSMEYPGPSPADERWFEAAVTRFGSECDLFVIAHQDITERRRRDQGLRRFGAAMEATADAIFLIDVSRMALVDVNGAACQMYGHSRADLLAIAPETLFSTTRHELETSWQALIAGDVSGDTFETRLQRADGTRVPVEVRRRAVRVGSAWLIAKVARDITTRKDVERALQRQTVKHGLLARFGQFALENPPLPELMSQAIEIVQQGLKVDLCRLLEAGSDDRTLVQVAGTGWSETWLREPCFDAAAETQDRFILGARESIVIGDFESQTRFQRSAILQAHGVRSAVEVLVCGGGGAYGVIGAYSREPGCFSAENADFVQSVSNTLAATIERKNTEDRLTYLAQFDPLTELPNRSMYLDRLGHTLIVAERDKLPVGVLFVDIDRFKNVNDTLGHAVGDLLLVEIAERLRCAVRPGDTVGRLGGDEFAVALAHLARPDDAALVAQKIVASLAAPFQLGVHEVYVSASIGIGVYPIDGREPDTLLKNADTAMYRAKESGRNAYQFYMPQMNELALARMRAESQLRGALDRGEYLLHYQPKVRLATGEISGMEALLRWQPAGRGLVPPGDFIPILEDTGLILPVGEWVVATVCAQIARWRAEGLSPPPVAVNLSARQFRQKNLAAVIGDILASSKVDPGLLELELTESSLMSDSEAAVQALRDMKARGIRLSVDDFGTGYSSLAYLKRFPLDALKIDREFIRDVTTDADGATIALAIINLARSLKLKVVAEGVETEEQLNFLRAHGCDEMQGYYFSRPLPVEEITRALREGRRLTLPTFMPPARRSGRFPNGESSATADVDQGLGV